jgi:hypothetical protein
MRKPTGIVRIAITLPEGGCGEKNADLSYKKRKQTLKGIGARSARHEKQVKIDIF